MRHNCVALFYVGDVLKQDKSFLKDMIAVINQRLLDLDYCNQFRESYRQLDTVVKKESRFNAFFRGSYNNNNDVLLPRLRLMGHKLTQKITHPKSEMPTAALKRIRLRGHPKSAMPGAVFENIASYLAIKDGMSLERALGKYWITHNHEGVLEEALADFDAADAGAPNEMMCCS